MSTTAATTFLDRAGERGAGPATQESSDKFPPAPKVSTQSRDVRSGVQQRIPVAIVGVGYIANYHVEALRQLGTVHVVGACDPDPSRLGDFCHRYAIPAGASSLAELLQKCRPAAVHVLTPPPYHFDVTRAALEAGLHALLEKPMVLRESECGELIELAKSRKLRLRVNHNAVFHPAFRRLLGDIKSRKLGRVEHVVSMNNLPLAQLDSGEHDHWMFREPANILFEQATHPLSQICALLGSVRDVAVTQGGQRILKTGNVFHTAWQLSLICERGTAELFIAFGRTFPKQTVHVIGQDGVGGVDLLNNTYTLDRTTKYLDPVDRALRSLRSAKDLSRDGIAGFANYVLSTLRLRPRSDAYYVSMLGGIQAFYQSLAGTEDPGGSALEGLHVVSACEQAARACRPASPSRPATLAHERKQTSSPSRAHQAAAEVLVLGATGFIGRHLIAKLAQAGHSVRVMSRRPTTFPADGAREPVVVGGDIRNAEDVATAVRGCRTVIHLVSGAPASWPEYERLFVDGTRHVAEACLRSGVEQLFFASSIAVYYLGGQRDVITEATPLDDSPSRSEYTRAKVACERLLLQMHREQRLPVTIFRPGVVVGAGGPPTHLGVGFWPTPTHCVTWGRAGNALPFVLADDVAAAMVAAIGRKGVDGQSFNLVGDVRLTAEQYVQALREASGRDIRLHRQSTLKWYGIDLAKWLVKVAARKPENLVPSYRNFASWTLRSPFDCSHAKRLLEWQPVADRQRFIELGIWRAMQEDIGA